VKADGDRLDGVGASQPQRRDAASSRATKPVPILEAVDGGSPIATASDPYKIADVYLPWTPDDDMELYDETEWSDPGHDAWLIAKAKSDEARNRVRQYLAMNGAAVWVRVERSLADATQHHDTHPAASIVGAVTAAELIIRYMLLRPMIAGLVFNTKLAMRLVREGYSVQTARDRSLLPDVCRAWDVELDDLLLPNGQPLWDSLKSLIEVRNRYVHRAEQVGPERARGAIDCAAGLLDQVVEPLAGRLGLEWPPTGWTHKGRTHDPVEASFDYMGS
jgi:hypothetical protein